MLTLGMPIGIQKMKILKASFLEIQISSFFQGTFFFVWDGDHS